MARLTSLVDTDIAVIAKLYDLEIERYKAIDGGDANSSYLLSGSCQDFVLTFYEKRSLKGVWQMVNLLEHLEKNAFRTNRVLSTKDSRKVSEFLGKPMVLKTWLPGKTLRDSVQTDFELLGENLAQLHQISAPDFLQKDHPYGLKHMVHGQGHGADQDYEYWLGDMITYLEENFPADLPRSLIHGDLFDDNILYHQGRFQAIIDFGDVCHYTRAYDLGSILFGACMVDGRLEKMRAAGILTGYQGRINIEAGEREAIQFFAVYAGAAISAWHYVNTYIQKPVAKRVDKYKQAAARTDHLFNLSPLVFHSLFD